MGQLHTSCCTRKYISKLLAELDLMYNHEFALAQAIEVSKHVVKTLKSVAAVEQSVTVRHTLILDVLNPLGDGL